MENKTKDFETFLELLTEKNVEIQRRGENISLRLKTFNSKGKHQKSFIRFRSLPENYTEKAIRDRINGKQVFISNHASKPKINLIIDIQNSIKAQNSPGYERWAKIFNLKQAAKTLIFLQNNDITKIDILNNKTLKAKDDFNNLSSKISNIDTHLKEIITLQKHIGTYNKTREIFVAYKKSGYNKKYFVENEQSIFSHKASKKYFNELNLNKLPTIKTLQIEYATLSSEKKKLYSSYHSTRKLMQEILVVKQNTEQLLNYRNTTNEKENERN